MNVKIKINADSKKNNKLVKKIAFFNSGMVPLERYKRDFHLIDRLAPQSLRLDLYLGDRNMEFGSLVDGTIDDIIYYFDKFDELIYLFKEHRVVPYVSWCYIPLPLQPETGDFRSYPVNEGKYYEIIRELSAHLNILMQDNLYYEEIYNEADCEDVFFTGNFDQFLRLYQLGCKAVKDAGSTALIGGPAEAFVMSGETVTRNMRNFIKFVNDKKLPMDFFSFHSYGYENKEYLTRTQEVLALLKEYRGLDSVEIHINELNVVTSPWKIGETILESTKILPLIFTMIDEISEVPEITLVHWAQFLASGIDALGLVDVEGRLMPAFFVFEIFGRMPVSKIKVSKNYETAGCISSIDETRFSVVLWNNSSQQVEVSLEIKELPHVFKTGDLFVLDQSFFDLLHTSHQLSLDSAIRRKVNLTQFGYITLMPDEVVYIESNYRRIHVG